MAEYIADSESQDFAELSGTYTTDEANKVITFGATGQANTGLTLPSSSEWLLIETYDVEGVAGDVGYTKWTSNTYNIASKLSSARAIVDAEYTIYSMVATHYKGNNTCDTYYANNTTAFPATPDVSGRAYTPSATWVISDTTEGPVGGQLYSAEIQIDYTKVSGSTSLTNFPVSITEASLTGGGVATSLFANCRSDGGDIRFYSDSAGTTQIAHELVSIDTGGGTIELHVKVPSVSTTANTSIYMRYGDTELTLQANDSTYGRNAVWSQYDRVYHFNQDPSTSNLIDSSGNLDGVPSTHSASWVTGDLVSSSTFKSGWTFVDTDKRFVKIGTSAQLSFDLATDVGYVTAVIDDNHTVNRRYIFTNGNATDTQDFGAMVYDQSPFVLGGDNYTQCTTDYAVDSELIINSRFDGTDLIISSTNSDVSSTNYLTGSGGSTDWLIGAYWTTSSATDTQYHANGEMCEFRLSFQTDFSNDWAYTERNNLSSPSTFFSSQTPTAL